MLLKFMDTILNRFPREPIVLKSGLMVMVTTMIM